SSGPEPDILHVQGIDAIIDNARAIIRAAQREIYLSVWEENVGPLQEDLDAAAARGLRIAGMLYGNDLPETGWWQRHSYRETVASRIRGRMLTMVADGAEALIAHMPA